MQLLDFEKNNHYKQPRNKIKDSRSLVLNILKRKPLRN